MPVSVQHRFYTSINMRIFSYMLLCRLTLHPQIIGMYASLKRRTRGYKLNTAPSKKQADMRKGVRSIQDKSSKEVGKNDIHTNKKP